MRIVYVCVFLIGLIIAITAIAFEVSRQQTNNRNDSCRKKINSFVENDRIIQEYQCASSMEKLIVRNESCKSIYCASISNEYKQQEFCIRDTGTGCVLEEFETTYSKYLLALAIPGMVIALSGCVCLLRQIENRN